MNNVKLLPAFVLQRFQTKGNAEELRAMFQRAIDVSKDKTDITDEIKEGFQKTLDSIKDDVWTFHGCKLTRTHMDIMIKNMVTHGDLFRILETEMLVNTETGYVAPGYKCDESKIVKEFTF